MLDGRVAVGWCLDANDLWVSKAAAARQKDVEFCTALARAGLIAADVVRERSARIDEPYRTRAMRLVRRLYG